MTEHYELSEVDVDTLGLVSQGANREEFFLMKSEDIQDEPEVLSESVWRKIAETIRKAFATESIKADTEDKDKEDEGDKEEAVKDAAESTPAESTVPATESVPLELAATEPVDEEPTIDAEKVATESTETAVEPTAPTATPEPAATTATPELIDTSKESSSMENTDNAMPTAEEYVSKADHEAVVQEVAVLKAELAKAQEEKERAIYKTAARSYTALPVSPDELADHMYWLAKTDKERYDWFESIIKAVDNTMHDANLFTEQGSSAPVENDAVSAALKSEDPRAALLSLDKSSANAYLHAMRKVRD